MSNHKCTKVRKPCKVCLRPVRRRTGLQCSGTCQSWIHYKCANYTPGKLMDVKKGIIKVNCPCPDCQTALPKEYRTDTRKSCANVECPSNRPPKCKNHGCPIYEFEPAPVDPKTCGWPGDKCKASLCKKYPSSLVNVPLPAPPPPAAMPCRTAVVGRSNQCSSSHFQNLSCVPLNVEGKPLGAHDCQLGSKIPVGDTNTSSGSLSGRDQSYKVLVQMCSTIGHLSKQLNELLCKMKENMKQRSDCDRLERLCTNTAPQASCPKSCNCNCIPQ